MYMNNHVHSAPQLERKKRTEKKERRITHYKIDNNLNGLEKYACTCTMYVVYFMHVSLVFCFALAISSKNKWASRRSSLGKLFRRKDRRSQGKKNAAKRFSEPVPRPGKYGFESHLG